jgi:RNA polymerase sigma-70 factor, ECF subfamily
MREIDAALVNTWQRGDEAGTRALFEAIYPYAVRLSALSGLSMDDARDCAQDAFTHAYERRMQLRDPQAFALWFHRILTRTILDRVSRQRRQQQAPLEAAEELVEDWQRNAPGQPDEEALEAERRAQVWRRVQGLEPRARLAITLRYYGDCSPREVAKALGIREGAARTLLSRALSQLRLEKTMDSGAHSSDYRHDDSQTSDALAQARTEAAHALFSPK